MAELKTQKTTASVAAFLDTVADPAQRADAKVLAGIMRKATGVAPAMWGNAIVGYGDTSYVGSRGRTVEWFKVGFSPRKAALVVYLLGGLRQHAELLDDLGRHKVGGGCLYLPRLSDVDLGVLAALVSRSFATAPTPPAESRSRPTTAKPRQSVTKRPVVKRVRNVPRRSR